MPQFIPLSLSLHSLTRVRIMFYIPCLVFHREDCIVTSKYPDGTETQRDCYVLAENSKELTDGTKGRFESCTQ